MHGERDGDDLSYMLRMPPVPANQDAVPLALRVAGVLPLLLKHGLEKAFMFSAIVAHFPDPLHIGAVPSLLFAMLSDSIRSLLLIAGLATRVDLPDQPVRRLDIYTSLPVLRTWRRSRRAARRVNGYHAHSAAGGSG